MIVIYTDHNRAHRCRNKILSESARWRKGDRKICHPLSYVPFLSESGGAIAPPDHPVPT